MASTALAHATSDRIARNRGGSLASPEEAWGLSLSAITQDLLHHTPAILRTAQNTGALDSHSISPFSATLSVESRRCRWLGHWLWGWSHTGGLRT